MVLWVKAVEPREDGGRVRQRLGGVVVEGVCELLNGESVDRWRVAEFLVACGRMKK
jgi:hypothetical protein